MSFIVADLPPDPLDAFTFDDLLPSVSDNEFEVILCFPGVETFTADLRTTQEPFGSTRERNQAVKEALRTESLGLLRCPRLFEVGAGSGVAFGMADGFRALVESGVDVHSISVIGGGAQSTYWGRILSAVLDRPMVYRDGAATGPAYGAARLARYAVMGGSVDEMFEAPEVLQIVEPKESDSDRLAPKYEKFGTLYRMLKDAF